MKTFLEVDKINNILIKNLLLLFLYLIFFYIYFFLFFLLSEKFGLGCAKAR